MIEKSIILQWIIRNDVLMVSMLIGIALLFSLYFFISLRMKIKHKRENKINNAITTKQVEIIAKGHQELKKSFNNFKENVNTSLEANKLPYSELSKIYDFEYYYSKSLINNNKCLINFLYGNFTTIRKIAEYLIDVHKRYLCGEKISEDLVCSEIDNLQAKNIHYCKKYLGDDISDIIETNGINIFNYAKIDYLKILKDKTRNAKTNRIVEKSGKILIESMRFAISEFNDFNPDDKKETQNKKPQKTTDFKVDIMSDIADNKTKDALDKLMKLNIQDNKQTEQIALFYSQYTALFDDSITNSVPKDKLDIDRNKLNIAILRFTNNL